MSNDKHTRLGAFFYAPFLFLLSKKTIWNIFLDDDDSFTMKKQLLFLFYTFYLLHFLSSFYGT
jgi:hypothetical protein